MTHVRVLSLDGWRAEYDRDEMPHRFDVFDAAGVMQFHISGTISDLELRWFIAAFEAAHCEVQMRLL